jgi:hypothetical protein
MSRICDFVTFAVAWTDLSRPSCAHAVVFYTVVFYTVVINTENCVYLLGAAGSRNPSFIHRI